MTLIEHLLELRSRVTWMAIAVVVGMSIFFIPAFGFRAIEYLLSPARQPIPDFPPQYIEPMANTAVSSRVALLGGPTLSLPVIVYHVMRFVTPAMTPQEKRWVFSIDRKSTRLYS